MDVRVGLWRRLSAKDWCVWTVVLEKTLEGPLDCKEIQPVHSKGDQPWVFIGRNDTKAETPVLCPLMRRVDSLEKTLMLEGLGAGGEGDDRGWDGRMASPTWWTWVWVNSGSWWWTGRPGVLRFTGSQRVRYDWANFTFTFKEDLHIISVQFSSVQFSSVAQSCPTLCDPINNSMPGVPVHHQLPKFTETHVHRVGDATLPSHPLSSPSPPAPNPSQHQGLFQWVNSSHEVAKLLGFQL